MTEEAPGADLNQILPLDFHAIDLRTSKDLDLEPDMD